MAINLSYEEITEGRKASFRHRLTVEEISRFAELSGDFNPLHVDESYAATTLFKRPIAHGMLLGALVSRLLGMQLPGRRCLWLSCSLDFLKPVFAGDELEVVGVVQGKHEGVKTLTIKVTVVALPDRLAVRGKAMVQVLE